MTPCQPLYEHFAKHGRGPQDVLRILDGDFLRDYISDPASKKVEVGILKQQMPLLEEELNSDEFFQLYERVVHTIFAAWIDKYLSETLSTQLISEATIKIDRLRFEAEVDLENMDHIWVASHTSDSPIITFPRCLSNINFGIRHVDSRPVSFPGTTYIQYLWSNSKVISIPKLVGCEELIVEEAEKITIGAADMRVLQIGEGLKELNVIPGPYSDHLMVGLLRISKVAKAHLKSTNQFSQMLTERIVITD